MAQTKVKTKGIADTNVTNAKLGTDISAAKLTAGTVADARFPATLPAASGVNLTALNATNIGSGTVPTARLGTGTASSSVFLAGDNTWAAAGGGKIGQVLQTVVSSTFSVNSASMVDLTGITVTITPVATSSKILVFFSVNGSGDPNYAFNIQIMRETTAIGIGDAASNRMRTTVHLQADTFDTDLRTMTSMYLDSPSSTSATTYKLQGAVENTSNPLYINRSEADADSTYVGRTMSQITVMEVLA